MANLKNALLRHKTNLEAFFKGYVRFQVALAPVNPTVTQDGGFATVEFAARDVRYFWTYAAADDELERVLQGERYSVVSMQGFNWRSWMTRSFYGPWHAFYLATGRSDPAPSFEGAVSARLA